jgi:hypothetical protein
LGQAPETGSLDEAYGCGYIDGCKASWQEVATALSECRLRVAAHIERVRCQNRRRTDSKSA